MGTTYQTFLVVGSLDQVRTVLEAEGIEAYLMPVGVDRTAVMPREGVNGVANTDALAQAVSASHGLDAMSQAVADSDFVYLGGFRDGRSVFRFRSDEPGDVELVAAIAPFGVGEINMLELTATLLDDPDIVGRMRGEDQHVAILEALNLDPRGLTTPFRRARYLDLPNIVRTTVSRQPATEWWTLPFVVTLALPADADPVAAAQILADSVTGRSPTMRADIGYTPAVPAAASIDPQYLELPMPPTAAQRSATYFVRVHVKPDAKPPNVGATISAVYRAWLAATRNHYGHIDEEQLNYSPITPDQFDVGYNHALKP